MHGRYPHITIAHLTTKISHENNIKAFKKISQRKFGNSNNITVIKLFFRKQLKMSQNIQNLSNLPKQFVGNCWMKITVHIANLIGGKNKQAAWRQLTGGPSVRTA